jgi:hypothetical protein
MTLNVNALIFLGKTQIINEADENDDANNPENS